MAALALNLLGACASGGLTTGGEDSSAYGDVATPGTAVYAIKQYYERRGREQNGMCTQMILEEAVRVEPVDEIEDELVLRVNYAYSARSGNTNRLFGCNGFGARDFTLVQDDGRWQVVAMSDPLT